LFYPTEFLSLVLLIAFLALSFVAISGWGVVFGSLLGQPAGRVAGIADFWLGYVFSLIAVEFLNLWIPIDWRISLIFFAAGLVFFVQTQLPNCRHVLAVGHQWASSAWTTWPVLLACVCFGILACFWAMAMPINEDSWTYHFQSIRWINEYPVIPGLGNLHGRLAFNQSHFGFLALNNFFPLWNKGYAAGGLLLLLAGLLTAASLILREIPFKKLLFVLLLVVVEPMAKYSASPSPDFAVSLVQIVASLYLVYLLHPSPNHASQRETDFLVAMCLGAALCSLKLSGLVFALALGCVSLWSIRETVLENKKLPIRLFSILLFFGLLHLLRGVIASGVPLYPSTLGSFVQFDWSVPIERVRNEAAWIYSCARTGSPCQDPVRMAPDWSWVSGWWSVRVPDHAKTLFFASLAASGVTIWANMRCGEPSRPALLRDCMLMAPFLGAMVFWFFSAPDVRFLGRLLELMFAVSVWSMVCGLDRLRIGIGADGARWLSIAQKPWQRFHFTAVALCLVVIFCVRLLPVPRLTWPALPQAATSEVRSDSGVSVYVPADGSCWFHPLPCTPSADPKLQYREPFRDDPLASGFRIRENP